MWARRHSWLPLTAALLAGLGADSRGAGAAESRLDPHELAEAFVARARDEAPEATFSVRELSGQIAVVTTWPDGGEHTWFVDRAYALYTKSPGRLDALLDESVRALREARKRGEGTDGGPSRTVLPVVRSLSWLAATRSQLASVFADPEQREGAEPLHRQLAGDLLLAFVEDGPDDMSFVTAGAGPARHGAKDLGELEARGLANLARRLPALKFVGHDGRFRLELDGTHEASMVLLIERWRDRVDVEGDPVLAIPSSDVVMVCGSRDKQAIHLLRAFARRIHEESTHGISPLLFVFREGRLSTFDPSAE